MRLSDGQRAGFNLAQLVRERSKLTGLTPSGQMIWQPRELNLLSRHYPNIKRLRSLLPHRTPKAIEQAAQKRGLAKVLHKWTDDEVLALRRMARAGASKAEFLVAFPALRWKQIESALSKRKIKRPRVPLKVFGEPVFDEVRRQGRGHGMFVYELADLTRSSGYFRGRPHRQNWKHLAEGVELFGGEVIVRWPDNDEAGQH
jgi:hypothetical protein